MISLLALGDLVDLDECLAPRIDPVPTDGFELRARASRRMSDIGRVARAALRPPIGDLQLRACLTSQQKSSFHPVPELAEASWRHVQVEQRAWPLSVPIAKGFDVFTGPGARVNRLYP